MILLKGYEKFFYNMNDEEWEYFAMDVLRFMGCLIIEPPAFGQDGGKDLIVEYDNKRYVVSCKHFIKSEKHVGVGDETSILDRIIQHNAKGFIGFYSTSISNKLQERMNSLIENGYPIYVFDKFSISDIIPKIPTEIFFKYGNIETKYYMNVSKEEYKPLECMICEKDILLDENIPSSLVALVIDKNGKLNFVYGCKNCFRNIKFFYEIWAEIEQVLHLKQLNEFNTFIDSICDGVELSNNFFEDKNYFEKRILQRIFPQNCGSWHGM